MSEFKTLNSMLIINVLRTVFKHHFLNELTRPPMARSASTGGRGSTTVLLLVPEIWLRVWRYLSWTPTLESLRIAEAFERISAALCSPSALITWNISPVESNMTKICKTVLRQSYDVGRSALKRGRGFDFCFMFGA